MTIKSVSRGDANFDVSVDARVLKMVYDPAIDPSDGYEVVRFAPDKRSRSGVLCLSGRSTSLFMVQKAPERRLGGFAPKPHVRLIVDWGFCLSSISFPQVY